jgi:flagellar operon protein
MNQISKTNFSSIEQMTGQFLKTGGTAVKQPQTGRASFHELLLEQQSLVKQEPLKFSKHANERLASRNIDLSQAQLNRLETGAKKAGEKGIHESLVMIDDIAFIVNIKNNTVVTAVNDSSEKIFTNIDGAVIA